jgi:hypothetical protein
MQQNLPTYVDALVSGYPEVQFVLIAGGSPLIYDDLEWIAGDAIPSKDDLDIWIKNNSLTQYQFRHLFTTAERVGIDNASTNTNIPAQYRAQLVTVMKDLELSSVVQLSNPQLAVGLGFLVQLGLLAANRPAQILSNTPVVGA